MGLFGRRKRDRAAHAQKSAGAARPTDGDPAPSGAVTLSDGEAARGSLAPVAESAVVQVAEQWAMAAFARERGVAGAQRIDGVVLTLVTETPPRVKVMLGEWRLGYLPHNRTPVFADAIATAGGRLEVLGRITHGKTWSAMIVRNGVSAADGAAAKAERLHAEAAARAEQERLARYRYYLEIDGDASDLSHDDFDPAIFRKRVAAARKTGGTLRFQWDEDWVESYRVTPDLVIELETDPRDGSEPTTEILNGPGLA